MFYNYENIIYCIKDKPSELIGLAIVTTANVLWMQDSGTEFVAWQRFSSEMDKCIQEHQNHI